MPVNESNTIQYTVVTSRVPDGTTLYWKTTGNTTNSDIIGGNTGSITVNDNRAVFNVTIAADRTDDGTKTLGIALLTESLSGPSVATTPAPIVINDTSLTPSSFSVNYLIVAGGGGGGSGRGGGGGAGGLLFGTRTLYDTLTYTVTIGTGGAGAEYNSSSNGSNGSVTTVSSDQNGLELSVAGGGYGGKGSDQSGPGAAGGSGGGGGQANGPGGAGISGQGNNGGTAGSRWGAAGGGGAGGVGGNGNFDIPGAGGSGVVNSIVGSTSGQNVGGTYYLAGGGGGGAYFNYASGTGGAGGGGGGSSPREPGVNGTVNTGGGGGAGGADYFENPYAAYWAQAGGSGGSGLLIISYTGSQRFTGGTVTTAGGNTIHTFTSSTTFTP
jgi:hypothetical protein